MEKKEQQLKAAEKFGEALYNLRSAGVKLEYMANDYKEVLAFIDRETGQHIGEYAYSEPLFALFGQDINEFVLSTDYFGDLLGQDPTRM